MFTCGICGMRYTYGGAATVRLHMNVSHGGHTPLTAVE